MGHKPNNERIKETVRSIAKFFNEIKKARMTKPMPETRTILWTLSTGYCLILEVQL